MKKTELDYSEYLKAIARLEALKNEKWSEETIEAWYSQMCSLNWNFEKFLERIEAVAEKDTYGRTGWQDWISSPSVKGDRIFEEKKLAERIERAEEEKKIEQRKDTGDWRTEWKTKMNELAHREELRQMKSKVIIPNENEWGNISIVEGKKRFTPTKKFSEAYHKKPQ